MGNKVLVQLRLLICLQHEYCPFYTERAYPITELYTDSWYHIYIYMDISRYIYPMAIAIARYIDPLG